VYVFAVGFALRTRVSVKGMTVPRIQWRGGITSIYRQKYRQIFWLQATNPERPHPQDECFSIGFNTLVNGSEGG
jgi:hypothetical protein